MGGRSSSNRGGGKKRFGPNRCTGAARSSHTGSMRMSYAVDFDQSGGVPEPGDAQAGDRACLIDPRVGVKRAQGLTGDARCSAEDDARAYLEHYGEAADLGGHRVQVAFALALGSCQRHVYPMVALVVRFEEMHAAGEQTACRDGRPHAIGGGKSVFTVYCVPPKFRAAWLFLTKSHANECALAKML